MTRSYNVNVMGINNVFHHRNTQSLSCTVSTSGERDGNVWTINSDVSWACLSCR